MSQLTDMGPVNLIACAGAILAMAFPLMAAIVGPANIHFGWAIAAVGVTIVTVIAFVWQWRHSKPTQITKPPTAEPEKEGI